MNGPRSTLSEFGVPIQNSEMGIPRWELERYLCWVLVSDEIKKGVVLICLFPVSMSEGKKGGQR